MKYKLHRVEQGDMLKKIAMHYYGGWDARVRKLVCEANGIADPNIIRAGAVLRLPGDWQGGSVVTDMDLAHADIGTLVARADAGAVTPRTADAEKPDIKEMRLLPRDYWTARHKKEIVVLHFTAGYNWRSAYDTFRAPGRVATPFIAGTDGAVYRLFDERCWSYHLGVRGRHSENFLHDKRSIGIEIVNIGPVWKRDGVFKDYVGRKWPQSQVVEGRNRDAHGGVKFPPVQVDAVCDLVSWLLGEYGIPKKIPRDKTGFQLPALRRFKGVVTHQMFRPDKYDMGVAFPFAELVRRCALEEV